MIPLAIIGIGCRFPGAENPQAYWHLISTGVNATRRVPPGRWEAAMLGLDKQTTQSLNRAVGGFVDDIDRFDAGFFGVSPEEAAAMDPQQRLLLEAAWHAIEDAAVSPRSLAGAEVGVFIGASSANYGAMTQMQPGVINRFSGTGNSPAIIANRISYFFNFSGPSFCVDAACSSSLLAVHLACQSLEAGEAKLALAGGVNAMLLPGVNVAMQKSGLLSPDGQCRVFDQGANGYVRGEGAGVVLLKPLDAALADGDPIYAVIRGTAVTQNGRGNGLTGPNQPAQEQAIRRAYQRAEIDPYRVDYVEAHSTGSLIGDAIELGAIGAVLRDHGCNDQPCAVGSCKTNIGHLEAAAGIAGLIKVALMLKQAQLPPMVNYAKANSLAPLERLKLRVPRQLEAWPANGAWSANEVRVAGVSASSYGGANVHAVLTSPPAEALLEGTPPLATAGANGVAPSEHLLVLSTPQETALRALAGAYATWIVEHPHVSLADLCTTALHRRSDFAHRLAVVARTVGELSERLTAFAERRADAECFYGQAPRNPLHKTVRPAPVASLSDIARGYVIGEPLDVNALAHGGRRIHGLPTYRFQRERHWMAWDATKLLGTSAARDVENSPPLVDNAGPPDEPDAEQTPPRTPMERGLAAIFEEVLGIGSIGVQDNFFRLGGNSLAATRAIARARDTLQREIPIGVFFQSPTIAALAAAIQGESPAAVQPILPVRRDAALPLSFAQPRFWFIEQYADRAVQNLVAIVHLHGPPDASLLRKSVDAIARRHETLRTTFHFVDNEIVQRVHPPCDGAIFPEEPAADFSDLSEPERRDALARLVAQEGQRRFDLTQLPLMRLRLARLGPGRHALIVTVHHMVFDAWSMAVFCGELSRLSRALRENQTPQLPALQCQYADFAAWQRQWLTEDALAAPLAYWKRKMANAPALLELPGDRPRPISQSYAGGMLKLQWPPEFAHSLVEFSQSRDVTLFITLLTGMNILLHRLTGQSDIVVGTPVAGRTRTETENLIGCFVNTLPLRANLEGNPTVKELLAAIKQTTLEAWAHQEAPFEKLVETLNPPRSAAHAPLFQALLVLQNVPRESPASAAEGSYVESVAGGTAEYDLALSLDHDARGLRGILTYSVDLFDRSTIERWEGYLRSLLRGMADSPDAKVADLPMLSPGEARLLHEFSAGPVRAIPEPACLHLQFQLQARRTPDAVAVTCGEDSLTYAQLDRQSDWFAANLAGGKSLEGSIVAVCLDRGQAMLIALLGILKTGAAYVPLDPTYPAEQLRLMLADAAPAMLVTQRAMADRFSDFSGQIRMIEDCLTPIDAVDPIDPVNPLERGNAAAAPDSLAYVIYTSGSTGRPKGVMVPHRGAVNLLASMAEDPGFSPGDSILAVTNYCFDISVLELFLPLLRGGRVDIVDRETARDPILLRAAIESKRPTLLQATPATWRMLIDAGWRAHAGLRGLCGGEALTRDLADRLLAAGVRLWNVYGPTETSIWSTMHRVTPGAGRSVSIGRPVANTRVSILDGDNRRKPIGGAGELCIGGAGVARGYLNCPELTAARFVPDPFVAGERIYRTGDQARFHADGTIEFLGRLDQQIKLRGFRIEPGEIEAALVQHPSVRQAAVIAIESAAAQQLAAFVVAVDAAAPTAIELRTFLGLHLPDHMIPSSFTLLDRLPVTATGKIDRRALARQTTPITGAAENAVAMEDAGPLNATEQTLASLWAEALGVKTIRAADDFFQLGGHSLLAVTLFARIEETFGKRLPLAVLFQHSTLGALARLLAASSAPRTSPVERPFPPAATAAAAASPIVAIQPDGDRAPLFVAHSFRGETLYARDLAKALGPRQPVFGLQQSVAPPSPPQPDSIETLGQIHADALLAVRPSGPFHLLGYSFAGYVALETARALEARGADVGMVIVIDARLPLPQPETFRARRMALRNAVRSLPGWLGEYFQSGQMTARFRRKARQSANWLAKRRRWTDDRSAERRIAETYGLDALPEGYQAISQWNLLAAARYAPRPYNGRIVLFRSRAGDFFDPTWPDLGWAAVTRGHLRIHEIPCRHHVIMQPPFAGMIADALQSLLAASANPDSDRPSPELWRPLLQTA